MKLIKNLGVRQVIALWLIFIYAGLIIYAMVANKEIPAYFTSLVTLVTGYYFGKSTALDNPKGE